MLAVEVPVVALNIVFPIFIQSAIIRFFAIIVDEHRQTVELLWMVELIGAIFVDDVLKLQRQVDEVILFIEHLIVAEIHEEGRVHNCWLG